MTIPDSIRALDAADPLAAMRDRFTLPEGVIYLDGNSLGALPVATPARVAHAIAAEWGGGLIRSWNDADWIGMPQRLGAKIAPLVGAAATDVVVADSTSVNLFKLIAAALRARPGRRTMLSEPGNFPTDLYIASGATNLLGRTLKTVAADEIVASIDEDTALVLLTHVHYKTGRQLDMAAITAAAHAKGALILWDLSHSVGAVRVDLDGCDVDLAVGCGYKYLNGGPGAPAFLFVARRLQAELQSPLTGWMGHAAPFAFGDGYAPADGIDRFLCGTPPILAMAALDVGLDLFAAVDFDAVVAKSAALCDLLIDRMAKRCGAFGFDLVTPRDAGGRGSHVSFAHPDAYPICQALIAAGVIGDFRAPDVLRLGLTPLYTRYADVWMAVEMLHDIMASGHWDSADFRRSAKVT